MQTKIASAKPKRTPKSSSQPNTTAVSATPPPALVTHSVQWSNPLTEETPTVVGSNQSQASPPSQEGGGVVILSFSTSGEAAQSEKCAIVPLSDWLPSLQDALCSIQNHHRFKELLSASFVCKSDQEKNIFVLEYFKEPDSHEFWDQVDNEMESALLENHPLLASRVKKCRDKYFCATRNVVDKYFGRHKLFDKYPLQERMKVLELSGIIGWVFVDVYESLITPHCGRKVVSVELQLDDVLSEIEGLVVADYFKGTVCQNVYYAAGFLCHAGQNESGHRTVNCEVVRCSAAVKDHFVTRNLEEMELKSNLPEGLADLVDQWAAYGGLSYPNLQFYTFVAKVEACYSRLANTQNFKIFGGTVLGVICHWCPLLLCQSVWEFTFERLVQKIQFITS